MMYAYLGRERDGTASNIATSHIKIINQSFVIPIYVSQQRKNKTTRMGQEEGGVWDVCFFSIDKIHGLLWRCGLL